MINRIWPIFLLTLVLSGCEDLRLAGSNRIYEERLVAPASAQRLLVLSESLVWSYPENGKRYEITLPPGAYHVEARDNDYTFYQAPGRISLGRKKGYSDQTDHAFDGGIFISRNAHAKYPSGAYTDLKNGKMLLLLFFDSRFARQEGKQWHYEE